MPKCRINGKEVEVEAGSTIIQAFQQSGTDIAHYCYHPGLSVAGVCRLCMVEIEGNPRPQIACNTQVTEGMVINNTSENIKSSVKWVLDFHLINHPLDCPICDQAGECGLQDQYMKFGAYDPEMGEAKVKKRKVVDLGSNVVLDTERCILCSRCVRFTDEVTKTHELGIFNRGDHSEIGTFEDKPLDNNYAVNTVDICPVGALTSKDFRFQQRVWYLKDKETVCNGCSTGCSVKMYFNEKGYFRLKPSYNKDVNGYWMCDVGRDMYKHVNKPERLLHAVKAGGETLQPGAAAKEVSLLLKKFSADQIALVLTGQYTNEEYESVIASFKGDLGSTQIYHWQNQPEKWNEFDGLLLRGDRNPNTKGLQEILKKNGLVTDWADLEQRIANGKIQALVVAGPEVQAFYSDLDAKAKAFRKVPNVIWLTANPNDAFEGAKYQIPLKTFVEKDGTFVNFQGKAQKIQKMRMVVSQALTLGEAMTLIAGKDIPVLGAAL
jgi:NADH-quinone oxidoreductase subunit G